MNVRIIKSQAIGVYKNPRYKIINYKDKYYLSDADISILHFMIPILCWIWPVKVYEISNEEAENLKTKEVKTINNKNNFSWGGVAASTLIIPYHHYFNGSLTIDDKFLKLSIIIFLTILILSIRFWVSRKLNINFKMRETMKLIMIPANTEFLIRSIILCPVIIISMIYSVKIFFDSNNLFFAFAYIFFLSFHCINNSLLNADKELYTISF